MAASEGTLILGLAFLDYHCYAFLVCPYVCLVQMVVDVESGVFTSGIVLQTTIINYQKPHFEIYVMVNIYQLRIVFDI